MQSKSVPLLRWIVAVALIGAGCGDASRSSSDPEAPATRPSGAGDPASGPGGPSGAPPSGSPGTAAPSGGGSSAGAGGSTGSTPGSGAAPTPSGAPPMSPPGAPIPPPGGNQPPQSGLLTAGTWDDNRNFDFFVKYHQKLSGAQTPGILQAKIADRLLILVTDDGGAPMAGARVTVSSGGKQLAQTQTGADGRALFFPNWAGVAPTVALDVVAEVAGVRKQVSAKAGDALVTLPMGPTPSQVTALDAAIVIDTTGSMGDEISYITAELLNISNAIKERYPTIDQRWAFVAYKDYQDEYISKKQDFLGDIEGFKRSFAQLGAGGGGDFEEAPERGIADMNTLAWRDGAVARVAFWVGDAPHHNERAGEVLQALRGAKDRGVHVYPVSASGTDERLEFSMRLGALITGGRYIFLTNDSGIGGNHKEPTIPCYRVTTLQKAMLRMLQIELTGAHVEPAPADVLRTGGNPNDGRCKLADGQEVEVL